MLYRTIKAYAIRDCSRHQITIVQFTPGGGCWQQELCVCHGHTCALGYWLALGSLCKLSSQPGPHAYTHTHTHTHAPTDTHTSTMQYVYIMNIPCGHLGGNICTRMHHILHRHRLRFTVHRIMLENTEADMQSYVSSGGN